MVSFEEQLKVPLRLKILLGIAKLSGKRDYSCSDIERELGFNKTRVDVRESVEFLLERELVSINSHDRGYPRYKIKSKKILNYLKSTDGFLWAVDIIKSTSLGGLTLDV